MAAVPSSIVEPIWDRFCVLIPPVVGDHPLGGHRPRTPDRIVFDKLVQVLVLGAAYDKIADSSCSATTIRRRRDEWIAGDGIPLGTVVAPANRHDCPLLRPTLETLSRFGFDLPETITVHLDAGYDLKASRGLLDELGCEPRIATKGVPAPIQNTKRWVVERTNAWHNRGFKKLALCTETHPGDRGVHRTGQRHHHHPATPPKGLAQPPWGWTTNSTPLAYWWSL